MKTILLASVFLFLALLALGYVWYYVSSMRDSLGGLTKEQKREIWEAFINGGS